MGAAQKIEIHGEKGGSSSPKSPVEASDSLRSTNLAKLLIAVGEGEFDGTPTDYDIYLDNTPIKDASGNLNFPNVKWDWRSGSVDQTYIPGIPSVENETSLNIELRSDSSWVRSITNIQLSALRVRLAWPALQQQDDSGNVGGYRIEYAVDVSTDGGAYQQALIEAVDGKTTTRYERSRRVDLPVATSGWQIRVRRITANQNSNKIADTMLVAGYTEVIDAKLRYPNTALLYIEFDAEQFTNIPAVTVKCKARKWQVPSNYDPVARTYAGIWDGTMKQAWTNNPAWITFGVCTEDRFGLGKRIKSFMVDKWELYRISQYCDQLVPNGIGGTEPRFLCDMNLQGKADAWSLLRDIAGIYRGMTYWAQGQLVMQADMPRAQDFDYVFTRANVIDGKFSYGSASSKTRYTRSLVSYDNPANNYDTDVIPFADLDLQRRMGDKPTEISAIGCTRASEAQRRGKWAILSNNQDRTVSFKTGMEGVIPLPGHIIPVADSLLAGREVGGRISATAGRVVTLDRDTQAKVGDRLIINLPGGRAEGRTVQSVNGRAVTVTTAYSEQPLPQLQWAIDADDLAIPLYRVLRTKRTTEGDFEISALQYEPSKFAYIDTGARLEERPISVIPITAVPAPASVSLTSNTVTAQGLAVTTMTIAWPAVAGAVAYDVEWRKDSGNWVKLQRTGTASIDVVGIYAGAYLAQVRAVSAFDISSIWRTSALTQLNGKEGLPPAVTSLTATSLLFGIGLKWGFPAGAEDTQRTELWYGPTTELAAATKLTDLAYPQNDYSMQSLLAGASFFFWARLVDRTGNIGPWYPVGNGVLGQASAEAGPILDLIAGQISETELGQTLLGRIDLIDGPASLAGSVASQVAAEATARVQADATEAQTRAAADAANATAITKEATDRASAILTEAQARQAAVTSETTARQSADTSLGQRIDTVTASNGTNAAAIQSEATARTTADSALGTRIDTVAASTASNLAAIGTEVTARTSADSALGVRIDTVVATATTDRTTQNAAVASEATARANGDTALGSRVDTVSATVAGKADTSAVNSLTARVTTAEGTITSQGSSITGLNSSLVTTNSNVTAAQTAANNANTLAGGKGKVLVQTTTPIAADQLVQNLWIDITSGNNTPKRWNGSAWAAVTDKVATDAAAAAANALSVANTKADASAVSSLTTRVTSAEGTITSQGSAITGLTGSLTTTNGNVTAAQAAADAANTLAGSKGKVIVQTATPAASDQLVQNLWIDITSSANTPKRWNGSAWAAVTDKVATDAAAAAANALSVANTKADASAVTALTMRVTSAEGTISSQGSNITNLTNSLSVTNSNVTTAQNAATTAQTAAQAASDLAGGKGKVLFQSTTPVAADQLTQNLWIDTTSSANTPKRWNGSAWAIVTDKVASDAAAAAANALSVANTKADSSAVTALTSRVTSAEGTISSHGTSITSLNGSLATTNSNVTTAQNAATAAATLAGSKGKTMVQTATPAVADQLAQNLWIDITGGANTPKRWDGSAWTSVSDKIATDAQAAALAATNAVASKADASAVNSLTTRVTTAEGTIASQGSAATTLTNRVTTAETNLTAQATAISNTNTAVTALDGKVTTVTTRIDGIYAQVNPALAGDTVGLAGDSVSLVGVWSEQSARIEDGVATGQRIDTVQVQVGQANATVQQVSQAQATADGKASAMWSVKLQVNAQGQYVAAGVGLGIENTGAGLQSQFLVSADRFAVVNGIDGTLTSPFAVQGGQVFIASAVIQDLSVSFGKISDNIQSNDYVANSTGWKLSKAGGIELNSTVAGQGRVQVTNRAVKVWDASGVLRVQLGDLSA